MSESNQDFPNRYLGKLQQQLQIIHDMKVA